MTLSQSLNPKIIQKRRTPSLLEDEEKVFIDEEVFDAIHEVCYFESCPYPPTIECPKRYCRKHCSHFCEDE